MKTAMRSLLLILLTVASGMTLIASHALAADEVLPPEVKALIGKRTAIGSIEYLKRTQIWKVKGAYALHISLQPTQDVVLRELYRDGISIFVIDAIDQKDKSTTMLDTRVLPRNLLNYDIVNGGIVFKENMQRLYSLAINCESESTDGIIIGLMRPEIGKEDCTHHTKQVKQAWFVDKKTGIITDISPQGIFCPFMDAEYSCK